MSARGTGGYTEFTVIADGALDEGLTLDWTDERYDVQQSQLLDSCERDAREQGIEINVYIIEHEHEHTDEECACVQYLTDHNPAFTFTS